MTTFARAVPAGVELVTSPGNHDSAETSRNYARAGATVLDGDVVEVDGLRILGDSDPNETRVGAGGTAQAGKESAAEEARAPRRRRVRRRRRRRPAAHPHPGRRRATLWTSGCVPAQISGHLHRRYGPERVDGAVRYISSSTAGATLGQPTVGPLNGVAEMTVLRWDPDTPTVRRLPAGPGATGRDRDRLAPPAVAGRSPTRGRRSFTRVICVTLT